MRLLITLLFAAAYVASAGTLTIGTASMNAANPIYWTVDLNAGSVPLSMTLASAEWSPGTLPLNNPPVIAASWWQPAVDPQNTASAVLTIPIDPTGGGQTQWFSLVIAIGGPELTQWVRDNYQLQCEGHCVIRWEFSGQFGHPQQNLVVRNIADTQVPEPSAYGMFGVAALALWWRRRR